MENMNIQVLEANNVLTMSSLEIAELTGKRHDNVVRDIKAMFEQLGDSEGLLASENTPILTLKMVRNTSATIYQSVRHSF